jgi:hypothetical protein
MPLGIHCPVLALPASRLCAAGDQLPGATVGPEEGIAALRLQLPGGR